MGSAGRDNFVCLNCGAWWGGHGTGKCAHCGGALKADRLLTEDDNDRLVVLANIRLIEKIKSGPLPPTKNNDERRY